MKYALIENGVVKQIQLKSRDGFIAVPDSVVCGMVKDGDSYSNPLKSTDELFEEEMAKLNSDYDAGMLSLANEYNIAVARDGSVETEKVATVRAKIGAMDNQYEIDQISLFNKYFGE